MAKSGEAKEPEGLDLVKQLESRIQELEEREARHWQKIENHLAKWGTLYDSQGVASMFLVDALVTGGANGITLTPRQGLCDHWSVPMELERKKAHNVIEGSYWVPEIIPERTEQVTLEEFDSEKVPVGANSKAAN